ncbi:ABC transporter ATP-binding protein, partial [[Eubacterium] siraeum]|nr:ABC transporter ATP-binding protein [[Eubacterium] siraeum]
MKKGEATDSQKDRFPWSADNDVYFLNELTEDEKQQLINTVDIPMTAAEMVKEFSLEELSSMTDKRGIKLPFTSIEQAGEMLG